MFRSLISRILSKEAAIITLFGSLAVSLMLIAYALEARSRWAVLVFAAASAATAAYSALTEVYPIMAIESLWSLVALRRYALRRQAEA